MNVASGGQTLLLVFSSGPVRVMGEVFVAPLRRSNKIRRVKPTATTICRVRGCDADGDVERWYSGQNLVFILRVQDMQTRMPSQNH